MKMDLSAIRINTEVSRYKAIVEFLGHFLKIDPNKVVDDTMESFDITNLNNVSVGIRRHFVADIIDNHFSSNSPKIQEFVRSGINQIFNIEEDTRETLGLNTQLLVAGFLLPDGDPILNWDIQKCSVSEIQIQK